MTLDIDRDQSAVGYTLPRVVTIVGGVGVTAVGTLAIFIAGLSGSRWECMRSGSIGRRASRDLRVAERITRPRGACRSTGAR